MSVATSISILSPKELVIMLVHGHGKNDMPRKKSENMSKTREYLLWKTMLGRCYSKDFHERNPTYAECIVSENFKSFSYFYNWCQKQVGFNNSKWQLDKDLLSNGSKIYSEDNCIFLPVEINNLFHKKTNKSNGLPIGVCYDKRAKKYKAGVRNNGGYIYLGYFNNPSDAFNSYQEKKMEVIVKTAERWKNAIDHRAYNAMINYKIKPFD